MGDECNDNVMVMVVGTVVGVDDGDDSVDCRLTMVIVALMVVSVMMMDDVVMVVIVVLDMSCHLCIYQWFSCQYLETTISQVNSSLAEIKDHAASHKR